jgi:hypothetical protein
VRLLLRLYIIRPNLSVPAGGLEELDMTHLRAFAY